MKIRIMFASTLLCAAAASAGAQQDGSSRAWFARMGIERSGDGYVYAGTSGPVSLNGDQLARMDEFDAALESAPDPDAALAAIDRRELDAEGRAPGSPSAGGEAWFAKAAGGWALTDAGRRAVPGILLKDAAAPSGARPAAPASAEKALDLRLPASRIEAVLSASADPNFDGAASAPAAQAPAGYSSSASLMPPLPDAPRPAVEIPNAPRPKPKTSRLEKDLFWSTWWGYHAAFAADFATTGMVIGRGGRETDHLYTQFGDKNMAGVIGSAVALHAVASVASVALHKEAGKKRGVWHYALEAAAIGINGYGIGVHSWGAGHNIGVLDNWNAPRRPHLRFGRP